MYLYLDTLPTCITPVLFYAFNTPSAVCFIIHMKDTNKKRERERDWKTMFQERVYEYQMLPFDLLLSLRVMVKCTDTGMAPLRECSICLVTYLDDWLLLAHSDREALTHTGIVLAHMDDLGFVVSREKGKLTLWWKIHLFKTTDQRYRSQVSKSLVARAQNRVPPFYHPSIWEAVGYQLTPI